MTRRRIPCTLSSRVIGPSSHSRSLGRVSTLGKIGQMALFCVHGKCQHYSESGQTRGGPNERFQARLVKNELDNDVTHCETNPTKSLPPNAGDEIVVTPTPENRT